MDMSDPKGRTERSMMMMIDPQGYYTKYVMGLDTPPAMAGALAAGTPPAPGAPQPPQAPPQPQMQGVQGMPQQPSPMDTSNVPTQPPQPQQMPMATQL